MSPGEKQKKQTNVVKSEIYPDLFRHKISMKQHATMCLFWGQRLGPILSNEKNLGWLGYIGDYTTQLYRDYFINHYKDPVINHPGLHGK